MTRNAYIDFQNGKTDVIKDVSAHECKGGFISIYKRSDDDNTRKCDIVIYSNVHVAKVAIITMEP
jgi:hypothetical protein